MALKDKLTLKDKLLLNRRFNFLKERGLVIDKKLEEYLYENTEIIYRLYNNYYSLLDNDCSGFYPDENLISLEIFINNMMVYRYDLYTGIPVDNIDSFFELNQESYVMEVLVNEKLFVFMVDNEIIIQNFDSNNIVLFEDLASIPGWRRLTGT